MPYLSEWGWWDRKRSLAHLRPSAHIRSVALYATRTLTGGLASCGPRCTVWFTSWTTSEFGFSIQGASLCISVIAGFFALGSPIAGWLGDRVGNHRRMALVAGALGLCALTHFLFGPWQLRMLGVDARRTLLFVYLPLDGVTSCLLEPQLFPLLLSLAEESSERADSAMERGEHLTNLVTSLGQTAINLGSVLGPFLAVPLVEAGGFRAALFAWGPAYALSSCWAWLCFARRHGKQRGAEARPKASQRGRQAVREARPLAEAPPSADSERSTGSPPRGSEGASPLRTALPSRARRTTAVSSKTTRFVRVRFDEEADEVL